MIDFEHKSFSMCGIAGFIKVLQISSQKFIEQTVDDFTKPQI